MSTLKTILNVLQRHQQYRTMLTLHQLDKMIILVQTVIVPVIVMETQTHKRKDLGPLAPNQPTTKKHEMTRVKMREKKRKKVQKERGRAGLN